MEAALSIYLESYATTLGSREQLAIGEFANALLVLPKTLAVNAAKDATELVGEDAWGGQPQDTRPGMWGQASMIRVVVRRRLGG